MITLLEKIQEFKIRQYGKIAINLRRGLISFDEAEHLWGEAEQKCLDLKHLMNSADTDFVRSVIETGIDSVLK